MPGLNACALLFLMLLAVALPSQAHAVCYCACKTPKGATCTVSIPDVACHGGTGTSRCAKPRERCKYDCSVTFERPATCHPLLRCGARDN